MSFSWKSIDPNETILSKSSDLFYGTHHPKTQRPLRGVLRDPSGYLLSLLWSSQGNDQEGQSRDLEKSSEPDPPN